MSDNNDLLNDNEMCSFSGHEAEDMCFNYGDDACGDGVPFVPIKVEGTIEKELSRVSYGRKDTDS